MWDETEAAAATADEPAERTRPESQGVTQAWLDQAHEAAGKPGGADCAGGVGAGEPISVIDEFDYWRKKPDLAEAVAAIMALSAVIRTSWASTTMELEIELEKASNALKSSDPTSISLPAGCDLFMWYVTRTKALEYEDFDSAKSHLMERGEKFGELSLKARRIIAMISQDFIFDGCTILVHGFSRVTLELLKMAATNKKLFRVLCTEGRPDGTGIRLSNELSKLSSPVKLLIDSALAYAMDEVDMVFVGADGVVESGGIINKMATYQIALVAHGTNKPVYVAAECYKESDENDGDLPSADLPQPCMLSQTTAMYGKVDPPPPLAIANGPHRGKFACLYPLDQKDLIPSLRPVDLGVRQHSLGS